MSDSGSGGEGGTELKDNKYALNNHHQKFNFRSKLSLKNYLQYEL